MTKSTATVWVCETCENSQSTAQCQLCNANKPTTRIPAAVVACFGVTLVKFSVTVLLPFYGSLPPRTPSTLRTFLVADALSFENLAHCGLTGFLSVLWWRTGVDFFGYSLLVVLLLLWAASVGELIVAAVSYNRAGMDQLYGPVLLAAVFFGALTCAVLCTLLTAIGNRRTLSLLHVPSQLGKQQQHQLSSTAATLRRILHCGLLIDVLTSGLLFVVEAVSKSLSSPPPRVVLFHAFLPSFMKSYTISIHHAVIITPGFVALRRLDNFVEVFIMVSMIFSPFLCMQAVTATTLLDSGLAGFHFCVKLFNIGIGILLRTYYKRNVVRNLKFELHSFSTIKPTLFQIACTCSRSIPLVTRMGTLLTSVGVVGFNVAVPALAVLIMLNERNRVGDESGESGGSNTTSVAEQSNYDEMTLRMICMAINFGIHGAIGM